MADPFCGCCQPSAAATPLAIFNRPGLSEIAYRVGTFATFREAMLETIAQEPTLAGLTSRESTDYAITILELFAAAGDVLTFYNERIANELFLRTARERDSLLRLTRLLGYRLRPGLAAQTRLSFALDEGAETRIRKALKVMSVPGQDEKPQIFETIEEIVANAELNEAPAYAPPILFNALALGSTGGPIVARPEKLALGDKLVLFGLGVVEEKTVAGLKSRSDGEVLAIEPAIQTGNWFGEVARGARLEGRLRFFGHNAPDTVNIYIPPPAPPATGWPRWEARQIAKALNPGDHAYPLDGRIQDIAVGQQLLIDAPSAGLPRLRTAAIVKTEDRSAVMTDIAAAPIESLRDTVTHVTLRQTIRDRPAVVGSAGTFRSVFARSGAGAMLELDPPSQPTRRWHYRDIDGVSAPVSAVALGARRDVFIRDAIFRLRQARMPTGTFAGWTDRGGILTSEPRAAAEPGGKVLVFARGLDLGLWFMDVTTAAVAPWQSLNGILTSAPAPASPNPGRFAVFVRGLDRALWYRAFDGATWSQWRTLKGLLATAPVAVSTGAGRIDVAALDDKGALIHRKFDGTEWSEWRDLGGELQGEPALVTGGAPDRIDVFAWAKDGGLATITRSGETWSDWVSLQGKLTSAPAAARDVQGLHVYARGSDGTIASRSFAAGSWSAWKSHGDGIGGIDDRRKTAIYRTSSDDIVFRNYDYPTQIAQGRVALRMTPGRTTVGNLAKGRRILLRSASGINEAQVIATIPAPAIPGDIADHLFVDFTPAPTTPIRDVTLLGNVAAASHGETQPLEALGHGDGAKAFQTFKLSRPNLTYLQTTGAIEGSAALEIRVSGELWKETPSFFGRRANERLYTARQNDNGETIVAFGDGTTGARIPSGAMNVTATYRTGLGLQGLMKAGQLSIPLERPPGLRSVANPLAADGAADAETRDKARDAAPNSVKTFGRAVSLADFEAIATASGLAARAGVTWVWSELERAVHVTVAGPLGNKLSDASLKLLRGALDSARDPNRPLFLANFVRVPIVVSARLLRDPAYEADAMLADARAKMLALFAFGAMPLGAAVFLSDIYATLQSATGVVAADIDVFHLKHYQDLTPTERAVRAVDAAPLQPHVRIFPARPTPPLALIDRFARAGFSGAPPPVLAAEQAYIEDPATDLILTAVEAI
jgi:hypothetical protein